MKQCRWVTPKLVCCQVAFVEWTDAEALASLHLRRRAANDNKAAEVIRETLNSPTQRGPGRACCPAHSSAAKKWDMAAAVSSHVVRLILKRLAGGSVSPMSLRRTESVEKAEAILLRAQAIHPKVAMIAFTLAYYASVAAAMVEAKEHPTCIELDITAFGCDWSRDGALWAVAAGVWALVAQLAVRPGNGCIAWAGFTCI